MTNTCYYKNSGRNGYYSCIELKYWFSYVPVDHFRSGNFCYNYTRFNICVDQVHRLVVTDEDDHVVGIVSLSDILSFLVLKPMGK